MREKKEYLYQNTWLRELLGLPSPKVSFEAAENAGDYLSAVRTGEDSTGAEMQVRGSLPHDVARSNQFKRQAPFLALGTFFGVNSAFGGVSGFLGVNLLLQSVPVAGQLASVALCAAVFAAYAVKQASNYQRTVNHGSYNEKQYLKAVSKLDSLSRLSVNKLDTQLNSLIKEIKTEYDKTQKTPGLFRSHSSSNLLALFQHSDSSQDKIAALKNYVNNEKNQGKALFTAIVTAVNDSSGSAMQQPTSSNG